MARNPPCCAIAYTLESHLTSIPLPSERTSYHLYFPTEENEEGQIAVTIHIKTNDNAACAGPLDVSYEYCWRMLHVALDNCDVQAEDGKYGGLVLDVCVWWVLDPNPRVNWPYTGKIS